jgi:nucleoside-diphosphate-sugar epimerase
VTVAFKMRVFLTGASGFNGSVLVPEQRGGHADRHGLPIAVWTASGERHETKLVHDALAARFVEELPKKLVGDRAYDSDTLDAELRDSGVEMIAPHNPTRKTKTQDARAPPLSATLALPQVHDTRRFGRITQHIQLARQKGRVAYVGERKNRLPALHVADAARAFRLALEKGHAGARYHAVGEEGVALRDIAEAIGAGLKTPEEAPEYFGWLAILAQIDLAASSARTRQQLGWTPTGSALLTDLRNMDHGAA